MLKLTKKQQQAAEFLAEFANNLLKAQASTKPAAGGAE